MKPLVFIISAPSGSGKSTLVNRVRTDIHNLTFSVSYTTRPTRGSERNGYGVHEPVDAINGRPPELKTRARVLRPSHDIGRSGCDLQRLDSRKGKKAKISAHYASNGATGADRWDHRSEVSEDVENRGGNSGDIRAPNVEKA